MNFTSRFNCSIMQKGSFYSCVSKKNIINCKVNLIIWYECTSGFFRRQKKLNYREVLGNNWRKNCKRLFIKLMTINAKRHTAWIIFELEKMLQPLFCTLWNHLFLSYFKVFIVANFLALLWTFFLNKHISSRMIINLCVRAYWNAESIKEKYERSRLNHWIYDLWYHCRNNLKVNKRKEDSLTRSSHEAFILRSSAT